MNKPINERFLKISSRLSFPSDIELGADLVATISGQTYVLNHVKSEIEDNQDGTVNMIYKLKALTD